MRAYEITLNRKIKITETDINLPPGEPTFASDHAAAVELITDCRKCPTHFPATIVRMLIEHGYIETARRILNKPVDGKVWERWTKDRNSAITSFEGYIVFRPRWRNFILQNLGPEYVERARRHLETFI